MAPGKDGPDSAADKQRIARFRILDLSAVGLAFPIALAIGYLGGRAIGGWLGNAQLGSLIGALLGLAGGFYNLFKMVSRLAPPSSGSTATPGAASAPAETEAHERSEDEADEGWIDDDWDEEDAVEDEPGTEQR